ncbi:MAG: hypothetical protein IPM98_19850 [Lewinellaceae bacterium]|nr:hypothetical protein [Lewinellaceae bacterium]
MKKTLLLTLGLIMTIAVVGFSQNLVTSIPWPCLSELPEVKQADSDLKAFRPN